MDNLVPVFVIGFLTLGTYRLFELFVRKSERMALIEKLGDKINLSNADLNLSLPFFQKQSVSSWALKIALLLIGIGLGTVIAFMVESYMVDMTNDSIYQGAFNHRIEILYSACIATFGGFGLLAAYFIEQKNNRNK